MNLPVELHHTIRCRFRRPTAAERVDRDDSSKERPRGERDELAAVGGSELAHRMGHPRDEFAVPCLVVPQDVQAASAKLNLAASVVTSYREQIGRPPRGLGLSRPKHAPCLVT